MVFKGVLSLATVMPGQQCAVYDLTVKAEGRNKDMLMEEFRSKCKKYVFQLEKGEETGYLHFQCRLSLVKKTTIAGAIALLGHLGHVSVTSTNGHKSDFYVMKEQTRVDGPWSDQDEPRPVLRTVLKMEESGLYPWQASLLEKVREYDDRTVHLVIDVHGNNGKSSFTKYVWQKKLGQPVPPMSSAEDLVQFVKSLPISRLYLIDMPRAMKKKKLYGLYSGIETIKNGMLYDKRYKGSFTYIDEPNIIVFTNTPPKMSYLSRDRWQLHSIDANHHLVPFKFEKS